jgi:hypothetical protein
MGLNENQRRTVTTTLRLLEERLGEIERVIQSDEVGILYRRRAHFTPTQVKQMRDLIAAMRAEIQRAATQFHLPSEEINPVRFIIGTLSLSWESLEDSRSRKLGAYGEVDPELNDTLDPILQHLIDLLFDLEDVARREGRPKGENQI